MNETLTRACEVTEDLGRSLPTDRRFVQCGLPATHHATPPDWDLCRDHALFALVAGWKPQSLDSLQRKATK